MHLHSDLGESFQLEQELDRGGEARIWTVQREPNLLAKIYHDPTPQREAKLRAMLTNPPRQPSTHTAFAWPIGLLYEQTRFVGFLMPRLHGTHSIFRYYNPPLRRQIHATVPWDYFLHHCARNLAIAVNAIHARGHVVGDLNESNTLVDARALVTLVDTDSFQIRDTHTQTIYRCPVGKAEFIPPELQGVELKAVDRCIEHDQFSLSVLIFLLLMEGYHPFSGRLLTPESVGRVDLYCIKRGWFPYAAGTPAEPPPGAPALRRLHPDLQDLFQRSFVSGHKRLQQRPTAAEWDAALDVASESLIQCKAEPSHVYSRHLRRCPHCSPESLVPRQWLPVKSAQRLLIQGRRALTPGKKTRIPKASLVAQKNRLIAQPRAIAEGAVLQMQRTGGALQRFTGEARETALSTKATELWKNWTLANVAGSGLGVAVAMTMNLLFEQTATGSLPGVQPELAPEAVALLIGTTFGCTVGALQWWAMRDAVFRHVFVRVAGMMRTSWSVMQWCGRTGLAGAWGALLYFAGSDWLDPVTMTILFGLGLGFLQSGGLRPYLRRAADPRRWTLLNAFAWSLAGIGWSLGHDLADLSGALTGGVIGITLTSILTGFALAWMAQTPTYRPPRTWATQMAQRISRWRWPRWRRGSLQRLWPGSYLRRWGWVMLWVILVMLAVQVATGVLR